jgi:hypothetical protein
MSKGIEEASNRIYENLKATNPVLVDGKQALIAISLIEERLVEIKAHVAKEMYLNEYEYAHPEIEEMKTTRKELTKIFQEVCKVISWD